MSNGIYLSQEFDAEFMPEPLERCARTNFDQVSAQASDDILSADVAE
jgi:hypothetical protein